MADTSSLAAVLDAAVRATGVPLVGVSVGDPAVRASWKAQLVVPTDPADQATADAVLATFDLAGLPAKQADAEALAQVELKVLRAVSQALWEAIPAPLLTKAQLRARALAIYKTL